MLKELLSWVNVNDRVSSIFRCNNPVLSLGVIILLDICNPVYKIEGSLVHFLLESVWKYYTPCFVLNNKEPLSGKQTPLPSLNLSDRGKEWAG